MLDFGEEVMSDCWSGWGSAGVYIGRKLGIRKFERGEREKRGGTQLAPAELGVVISSSGATLKEKGNKTRKGPSLEHSYNSFFLRSLLYIELHSLLYLQFLKISYKRIGHVITNLFLSFFFNFFKIMYYSWG